jgi:hypothetical protein
MVIQGRTDKIQHFFCSLHRVLLALGGLCGKLPALGAEEGANQAIFSGLGFARVDKTDRLFAAECLAAMAQ